MKVLVTGSEGFLGRHVCAALRKAGHVVVGLDLAGTPEIIADITKVIPLMQLDAVVHLAAVASPNVCVSNPVQAFNVNVNGTHQVLRLALESGAKKFVFSSSAHVYDIPPRYLPTDECHPLRLNNVYTTTKLLGEQLCHLFFENHGLSYTTLRLFNAYGPGQSLGYFIPDTIAKTGRFDLMNCNTTKDWVFVGDVARAFVAALETAYVGPVNIGTGVEHTLGTVAQIIATTSRASVTFLENDKPTRMRANWGRAERILGWEPTIMLAEGLSATLNQAKERSVV